MDFLRQYFDISTTESAISEQGILPEKLAPVYPNKTFMNIFKAICLSFSRFFMLYLWYSLAEFFIMILDIKN